MPKDAAFWQFLYLIFCKMHDERARRDRRRFWAGPKEQFNDVGRKAIRKRIEPLFGEVKQEPNEQEITRDIERIETITVGGRKVARTLRRKERIPDNDLPEIAKRYRAFRREHPVSKA